MTTQATVGVISRLRSRAGTRRPSVRTAVFVLVPVATLLVVGMGALMSASSVVGLRQFGSRSYFVVQQAKWVGVGVVAMVVTARTPYHWYRRLAGPIFAVSLLGLVAVLVLGDVRNGARSWIVIGGWSVQPSEFAKLGMIVALAAVAASKGSLLERPGHFAVPALGVVGLTAGMVLVQGDFGTASIMALAGLFMLVASQAPIHYTVSLASLSAMAGVLMVKATPYRWERVTAFLNLEAVADDAGYQTIQGLVALGTGKWLGVGLGASRARWSFLPNAHTDFIFAIIGEELGFTGAVIVLALFAALAVSGTVVALRAKDMFGRLLAVGIVSWISVQALVNVGGVTATLPVTGVPLPFISYGGSALVAAMAGVGILVNIANGGGERIRDR